MNVPQKIQVANLTDAAHIPIIARWRFEEWGYLYPEKPLEVWEKEMLPFLNRSEMTFYRVALLDNAPVGVAALKACDMEGREDLCPWIASVVVDKNHRKQGIGGLLVQDIQKIARNMAFKELFLYTFSHEDFYHKLGWQTFERTQYLGNDAIIMKSPLSFSKSNK